MLIQNILKSPLTIWKICHNIINQVKSDKIVFWLIFLSLFQHDNEKQANYCCVQSSFFNQGQVSAKQMAVYKEQIEIFKWNSLQYSFQFENFISNNEAFINTDKQALHEVLNYLKSLIYLYERTKVSVYGDFSCIEASCRSIMDTLKLQLKNGSRTYIYKIAFCGDRIRHEIALFSQTPLASKFNLFDLVHLQPKDGMASFIKTALPSGSSICDTWSNFTNGTPDEWYDIFKNTAQYSKLIDRINTVEIQNYTMPGLRKNINPNERRAILEIMMKILTGNLEELLNDSQSILGKFFRFRL